MLQRANMQPRTGPLDVVLAAGYDSTNHALAALAGELVRRGHRVRLVAADPEDRTNLFMFEGVDVPVVPARDFRSSDLGDVDFLVAGPFVRRGLERLFEQAAERGVFVVALANLFASATMWVTPDLVVCPGVGAFAEFETQGLPYRMVAAGNPQYDSPSGAERARDGVLQRPVRSALFVDQGAYPVGAAGKQQLADALIGLARRDPSLEIHVKPRYARHAGGQLHAVSDHLFDHLEERPGNLVLLEEPASIGDLLPRYDALATMFSTAHLEAVAAGIPLLLVSGLDSADVFDIRHPVVARAYARMRDSGCVVDVRDLSRATELFRLARPEYAQRELYRPGSPASPRIVEMLERIADRVTRRRRALTGGFHLTHEEFMDRLDELDTVEADSERARLDRHWQRARNGIAQRLAFENRCCGFVFDTSVLDRFWDVRLGEDATRADVSSLTRQARAAVSAMKARYFETHAEVVDADPFLQDAYFNFLYETGRFDALSGYARPVIAAQSHAFALARANLRRGRLLRALRQATSAFDASLREPVPTLRLDKNVRTLLQRGDRSLSALAVLLSLAVTHNFEGLAAMELPDARGVAALAFHKARSLARLGRPSAALEASKAAADGGAAAGRARGEAIATRWYRWRLRRLAAKLARA